MRSQAEVEVAQIAPRQSASLADVHDLRTERASTCGRSPSIAAKRIRSESTMKCRAVVTQTLGEAKRLVGEAGRLFATAEIAVFIDHERLHATEVPQRTLPLERLGGSQADPDSSVNSA